MFRWLRRKPVNDLEGDTIVALVLDCKGPEFCERERQRVATLAAENELLRSALGDGLE